MVGGYARLFDDLGFRRLCAGLGSLGGGLVTSHRLSVFAYLLPVGPYLTGQPLHLCAILPGDQPVGSGLLGGFFCGGPLLGGFLLGRCRSRRCIPGKLRLPDGLLFGDSGRGGGFFSGGAGRLSVQ